MSGGADARSGDSEAYAKGSRGEREALAPEDVADARAHADRLEQQSNASTDQVGITAYRPNQDGDPHDVDPQAERAKEASDG